MVLKAIDMQVLIPRSHDVGKIQQLNLQQQANQGHHIKEELHRELTIKQNSANQLDHMINDNLRDNKNGTKKQSFIRENDSEDTKIEEEENNISNHLGNILDIHI